MSRIKHPEYATPPATVHPTDIARGLVDPDEAARRWNAYSELVDALKRVLDFGRLGSPTVAAGVRDVLASVEGPK